MRVLALGAVIALGFVGSAMAADVVVRLRGVEARGGVLMAALNTPATFLQGAGVYNTEAPGLTDGEVELVFRDVAPGEYALTVMHDANGNGAFDMEPSGMPGEGFAFSNKGQPAQGMPTFEGLKFTVGDADVILSEQMLYLTPRP